VPEKVCILQDEHKTLSPIGQSELVDHQAAPPGNSPTEDEEKRKHISMVKCFVLMLDH